MNKQTLVNVPPCVMIKRLGSLLLVGVSLSVLTGCSGLMTNDNINPGDPEFAPVPAQSLNPPPNMNGSLFQNNYAMSLYGDQKARRIGDIITVQLQEQTSASKSTESSTSKDASVAITTNGLLGGNGPGILPNALDASRSTKGGGDADRSNSLQGSITVTIADILPNGILEVRGEKWLTLSEGDEFIRLRGLVRPQDISPDNTIQSSKIADARISFGGKGALSDAAKAGWLSRFFNSPWWPF